MAFIYIYITCVYVLPRVFSAPQFHEFVHTPWPFSISCLGGLRACWGPAGQVKRGDLNPWVWQAPQDAGVVGSPLWKPRHLPNLWTHQRNLCGSNAVWRAPLRTRQGPLEDRGRRAQDEGWPVGFRKADRCERFSLQWWITEGAGKAMSRSFRLHFCVTPEKDCPKCKKKKDEEFHTDYFRALDAGDVVDSKVSWFKVAPARDDIEIEVAKLTGNAPRGRVPKGRNQAAAHAGLDWELSDSDPLDALDAEEEDGVKKRLATLKRQTAGEPDRGREKDKRKKDKDVNKEAKSKRAPPSRSREPLSWQGQKGPLMVWAKEGWLPQPKAQWWLIVAGRLWRAQKSKEAPLPLAEWEATGEKASQI